MKYVKAIVLILIMWTTPINASSGQHCNSNCTFVLKSEKSQEQTIVNSPRARQRMTPWSTFKIPNSLIALDTKVIPDISTKLKVNKNDYPVKKWWPKVWYEAPITLQDAFKYSALPIYQSVAKEIGAKQMQKYIDGFKYGNQDISSGIDDFWLNKSIKISAMEQVAFLQKIYNAQLPVSAQSLAKLKEIMLVESTPKYKLYAKTGAGNISKNHYLGWYVGFVETSDDVYFFALNIDGKTFREVQKNRIDAVMEQLSLAGVI